MSDTTASVFVRDDLVAERPAPVKTTGVVGFLRTRLFNSPTNILITIVSALLLWFLIVPALRFLLGYHYGFLGYPKQAVRELVKTLELAPSDAIAKNLRRVLAAKLPAESSPTSPDKTP